MKYDFIKNEKMKKIEYFSLFRLHLMSDIFLFQ